MFFAASGSQQREAGMYLIWEQDLYRVRQAMGNYEGIPILNKRLARLGQCTSQAMVTIILVVSRSL